MGQKGFSSFLLLGGILIVIVVAGAFYLGRQTTTSSINPQAVNNPPVNYPPTQLSPSPIPTSQNPTDNWQVYNSEQCAVKLRYPSGWNVKLINSGNLKISCAYITAPNYSEIPNSDGRSGTWLNITRTQKGSQFKGITINTLDDYINADNHILEPSPQGVSDVQAKTYGTISGKFYNIAAFEVTSNFIFEKGNYIYNFSFTKDYDPKYKNDLENIISSVQF